MLRGKRVNGVSLTGSTVEKVSCVDGSEYEADAVVMAVGISGAKAIVRGCPTLASRPEFASFFLLRAVDVVAIRLWLPRKVREAQQPLNAPGARTSCAHHAACVCASAAPREREWCESADE